ncbi:uncharacterized protein LOC135200073 [Macrobrachium nipponense]|uniref:uncharacterized protein LOC135200073 n=1 Tax=Macrobrachium nipponense TaxID=159736 RepID=UPI0030C8B547
MPMALPLGLILLVVAGNGVQAYSMNDFISYTSTFCPGFYSCQQRNESVDFPQTCECHDDCIKYSTCCYDATAYEKREMKRSLERSKCIYETRMTVKCSEGWKDEKIQELCEMASPLDFSSSKTPILHLPVTSKVTNATYPNYYCAICNRDAEHIQGWKYEFGCSSTKVRYLDSNFPQLVKERMLSKLENCSDCNMTTKNIISNDFNLTFPDESEDWRISVKIGKEEISFYCQTKIYYRQPIDQPLEKCFEEIDTCLKNWNDKEVEDLCNSFKGYIEGNFRYYRNIFCAICNKVFHPKLCSWNPSAEGVVFRYDFRILYKVPEMTNQDLKSKCEADEDFFPNYCSEEKTTDILCQLSENRYRDGFCIKKDNSPKRIFGDGNNSMNGTHGDILLMGTLGTEKSSILSWVTFSLISISVVCLLLHLAISVLSKEMRSLPRRNMASLCISLLLSYITFITGPFLETNTTACYVSASVMYFSWIASFCWMSVIGFDTWWCFEKMATDFHLAQGSGWFRFLLYSVSSWLTSAVALAVLIIIDQIQPEGIDISLLPKLGREICWFGENESLQVFFVYPVISFVVIITILFVRTAWIIFKSSQGNGNVTENCARRNLFKINLRLGVIMGIPWTTYILSWCFGTTFLTYVFVIMNSLQGTFIFFAFSCKRKRWRTLLRNCQAGLNTVRKKNIEETTSTPATEDDKL